MKVAMRKPIGMALGFAVGYYLGAMAGRERYEQVNELLRKAQQSSAVDQARTKAKPIVDRGVQRVRGARGSSGPGEEGLGGESDGSASGASTVEGAVE
jgi:hypothetical protein